MSTPILTFCSAVTASVWRATESTLESRLLMIHLIFENKSDDHQQTISGEPGGLLLKSKMCPNQWVSRFTGPYSYTQDVF